MSTLSSIGFPANSMEDHFLLLDKLSAVVKQVKTVDGHHFVYIDESGAEIWIQTNNHLEPLGFKPHFSGSHSMRLNILAMESGDDLLGGTCVAWTESLNPSGWDAGIAFKFDMPDYRKGMFQALPVLQQVNLCLFASQAVCLNGHMPETRIEMDALFANMSYPQAIALQEHSLPDSGYMDGQLLNYALKTNQFTRKVFLWMTVKSAIGILEVVCDPDDCEGPLVIGNKLICQGWLSARKPGKPEFTESLSRMGISFGF